MVEVIAEIGQNHQGSIEVAKVMIDIARKCGVDTVKFQKWDIEKVKDFPYDSPHSFAPTYRKHRKVLDLSIQQLEQLKIYAKDMNFLVSAVDAESADKLAYLFWERIKVPSCRLRDEKLRRVVSQFYNSVILSVGGWSHEEITTELKLWADAMGPEHITVMHCISEYPTDHYDLLYIKTLQQMAPWHSVGFSSHDRRIDSCQLAVSLGATMIEKHFTLSRSLKGTDHAASLEPHEFYQLVQGVRKTGHMLGSGVKQLYPGEMEHREKMTERAV